MKSKTNMKRKAIGQVLELFISEKNEEDRLKQKQITIDINGVIGDKFYGKNIQRSILLVSKDSYTLAKENDININYGQLGENILLDYNPYHLEIGQKLQIGEMILEISQECTLCQSFSKVDERLPKILKKDRGIFAKNVKSGVISKGDYIYIVD